MISLESLEMYWRILPSISSSSSLQFPAIKLLGYNITYCFYHFWWQLCCWPYVFDLFHSIFITWLVSMSCFALSCCAILSLDLYLPPRGLVLNFELQQGHRTPRSHFINNWHTWQRFCPSRYLLKLALGFCILWRIHIPLHVNFFITSDNATAIGEQERYCSFGVWHYNMEQLVSYVNFISKYYD